jgi:hypothetical protein
MADHDATIIDQFTKQAEPIVLAGSNFPSELALPQAHEVAR